MPIGRAQDERRFRLAVRRRTEGRLAAGVDRGVTQRRGRVTIEPLGPWARPVQDGLMEDAAEVLAYLGLDPRPPVMA